MKYKVSALALMIAVSAGGSAWAQNFPVDISALGTTYVAVDANGMPVDNTFADPITGAIQPTCTDCKWVDVSTLTPAAQSALSALPNAAKTGLAFTGFQYNNQVTGKSISVNDGDVTTNGDVSAKTLHAGGVDVGSTLADHGNRIATLETSNGALQVQVDGQGNVLNDHGQKIGQLRTDVDGLVTVTNLQGQRIGDLEGWKVGVDGTLSDHGTRIGNLETTSAEHTATLADHGARIGNLEATKADTTYVDSQNAAQDAVILNHGARIGNLEDKTQTLSGDASGVTANGNFTVNGQTNLNGGLNVKGGTTTDTLHVTGKSVFDDAVTVQTSEGNTTVKGGGASFTDTSGGNTTISGGDVTSSGTISAKTLKANGRDVGQSLADHDNQLADHNTRINHVQGQADATDNRLNSFNGTGGTVESWATGVDNWRVDTNAWRNNMNVWRDDVNATLATYGSDIAALQGWQKVATAQISNLQGRMSKVEGAAALAMTLQVPTLEAGKQFGLSVDVGGANSTGAFTVGAAVRLNDRWQLHGGGGAATNGEAWGGRVGVTGQW